MGTEYRRGVPPREMILTHCESWGGVWQTPEAKRVMMVDGTELDPGCILRPVKALGEPLDWSTLEAATYRWFGERIPPAYVEVHQWLNGGRWTLSPDDGRKGPPAHMDLFSIGTENYGLYEADRRHSRAGLKWSSTLPMRPVILGKAPVGEDGTPVGWQALDREVDRLSAGAQVMLQRPDSIVDTTSFPDLAQLPERPVLLSFQAGTMSLSVTAVNELGESDITEPVSIDWGAPVTLGCDHKARRLNFYLGSRFVGSYALIDNRTYVTVNLQDWARGQSLILREQLPMPTFPRGHILCPNCHLFLDVYFELHGDWVW